jgi:hypothetical protein
VGETKPPQDEEVGVSRRAHKVAASESPSAPPRSSRQGRDTHLQRFADRLEGGLDLIEAGVVVEAEQPVDLFAVHIHAPGDFGPADALLAADDLSPGTLNSILKQAGLKERM